MSVLLKLLVGIVPVALFTFATAVYLNRRRLNKLHQRLFGLDKDPVDDGYILEMNEKMDRIYDNVQELNQRRLDSVEERLETLTENVRDIRKSVRDEEE